MQFAVHALDTTDSTQSEVQRLAAAGAPEGTVVTARHQRAGRGRRGHDWWDAPGESLLVSVLLRPPGPVTTAPQLSLVGGLAVADALAAAAGVPARIRWPNDLLVEGRKVCGILAEAASGGAAAGGGRLHHVILGIGINLAQTAFPAALADRATSLRLVTGRAVEGGAILAAVLDAARPALRGVAARRVRRAPGRVARAVHAARPGRAAARRLRRGGGGRRGRRDPGGARGGRAAGPHRIGGSGRGRGGACCS